MRRVKVAIIGAGTAGLTALAQVQRDTSRFVIVNDGPYGTTCARVGCMPSKALLQIADDFHRAKRLGEVGISGGERLNLDQSKALKWVREYRDKRVAEVMKATHAVGDRNIAGKAEFLAPSKLRVHLVGGQTEDIQAEAVIIATGSRPVVPSDWRLLGDRILTTDNFFEQSNLPKRLAIVGLGAVGLELGQASSRLGVEVRGYELRGTISGLSDPVLNDYLLQWVQSEFPVNLGKEVSLRECAGGITVDDGNGDWIADSVLACLGRAPNLESLRLDRLGLALDKRGFPPLDPQTMRVGQFPIFMAGDVTNYRPVMHEASDGGFIAALCALQGNRRVQRRVPMSIAFTDPQIAKVGKGFSELEEGKFVVASYDFTRQGRALAMRRAEGKLRLYAEPVTGRFLGAEMVAPGAEHLAHWLALACEAGLSVEDMLKAPIYHPVLEEGMRSAIRHLGRLVYGRSVLEFGE